MSEKPKVYFAHSTSDFNTDFERRVVEWLSEEFEVINPNCPEGAMSYKTSGMAWFHEQAEKCDLCAVLPLPDKSIGSGVYATATKFFKRQAPVFIIDAFEGGTFLRRDVPWIANALSSKDTVEANRRFSARPNGGRA